MVILNSRSEDDLISIFYGLIVWEKHPLELEHAKLYLNDMRNVCQSIGSRTFHFNNKFSKLKKYGDKLHTYKRNKQTQWFIIYNIDRHGNIFINHITSNHNTKAGTN